MLSILKFIHLSSLVVWIGTIVFFSFLAAPSIFKVLPRETAGDVVGDIFPKYWMVSYVAGFTALLSLIVISFAGKFFPFVRILALVAMTVLSFYSGLVVGAEAREIKAQIRVIEDQAEKETLREDFKKLHAVSSYLNMLVLALGVVVVFLTARTMGS